MVRSKTYSAILWMSLMVTPLRWTATKTAFSKGWSSHHATLHWRWLMKRCWTSCVQCGSGLYGLPSLFSNSKSTLYPFLFAHTLLYPLEQWNDNQDKKRANEGMRDLFSVGGICPLYPPCTSHHTVLFCPFLLTTILGLSIYLK